MKTNTLKLTGLILAMAGAFTLAQAKPEGGGPPGKEHPQGEARGEKGQRPDRAEMMKRYDKDGDGQLSDAELEKLKADRDKERAKRGGEGGERPSREQMMERFDKDGDGELSETERAAMRTEMEARRGGGDRRREMVEKFDADGDGQLSEEERAQARAEYEKRRQEREAAE